MTIIETSSSEITQPTYDLSPVDRAGVFRNSLLGLSDELGVDLSRSSGNTDVLMVGSEHSLANVARSIESDALPNSQAWLKGYESCSRFLLVLADAETDPQVRLEKPAHVFRINSHDVPLSEILENREGPIGLPSFDDFLKMGIVSEEELLEYYNVSDLATLGTKYIDVPANVAVEGVKKSMRHPYSAIGYKAIFEVVRAEQKRGVVAYQNDSALRSLEHLGIIVHPLCNDSSRGIDDDDAIALGKDNPGRYSALTIEGSPWSLLQDGSPDHNSRMFSDQPYAAAHSRLAGLIAGAQVSMIKVL